VPSVPIEAKPATAEWLPAVPEAAMLAQNPKLDDAGGVGGVVAGGHVAAVHRGAAEGATPTAAPFKNETGKPGAFWKKEVGTPDI
jgi:hypothetical protein